MKKKKFLVLAAVVAFLGCGLGFFQPTNTSSNVAYATEMGQPIMYKKNVTITNNGYKIWGDFKGSNWTQRSHSKDHLNKTYNANAYYIHPTTKEKYYSLFTEPNAKGTWIGYLNEKAIEVAKEATITIKYVDSAGKTLKTATTAKAFYKDIYTASAATIAGYTLMDSDSQSFVVNGNRTVTFTYKKNAPVKYNVTVQHVSGSTVLKTDKAVQVEKGRSYTAKAVAISGYTIKGAKTQTKTINGTTTITFEYTKNAPVKYNVTVKHVSGKTVLRTDKAVQVEKGKSYTAKAAAISGYTIKGAKTQTKTINGTTTITFEYTKNAPVKYKVTVKHVSGKTVLKTDKAVQVEKGKSYTAKSAAISGYTIKGAKTQTKTINGATTITFEYTKNAPVKYKVTVKHVSGKTVLKTDKAVQVEKGKNYTAKAAAISGYTVKGAKTQTKTINGTTTITFEYTKNAPVKYKVTVKHVSGKTVLKTDKAVQVEKGKNYTAKAATFSGYTIQGAKTQTKTINGATTITFEYTKNAPVKYKVTVKHISGKTVLKTDKAVQVEKGKSYTAKAAAISGYTIKGAKTQTKTINGTTMITFEYTKNAVDKGISYRTHVQSYGWQKPVANGATSGTTGKAKRLEGINIYNNTGLTGEIRYRTHIQTIGWQATVKSPQMSGTEGRALRLEAIRISLTGKLAEKYDVYYRVHAQTFGWLGWAKNGASAGTAGYAYRLEGIQVKLVAKGQKAPGSTANAFKDKNQPQQYTVTVLHKGSDKKELAKETVKVNQGASYTAKAKSFKGYTLKGANAQTIKVAGNKTLTFNYQKNTVAVNKAELKKLYDSIAKLTKGNYTDASWKALDTARSNGKKVLNDTKATQAQVDTAKNSLQTAKNGLKQKPAPVVKFKVTVIYSTTGGMTLDHEVVTVEKGKSYTAKARTFDGYQLKGEGTKTVTVNSDMTLVFNYDLITVHSPEEIAATEKKIANGLFEKINVERAALGLKPAKLNQKATTAASVRAKEIATLFEHRRPDGRGWSSAIYDTGFKGLPAGENIGNGSSYTFPYVKESGVEVAYEAWKNSPDHYSLMMSLDLNENGVGIYLKPVGDGYYNLYFAMIGVDEDVTATADIEKTERAIESQAFTMINAYRASKGLKAVAHQNQIQQAVTVRGNDVLDLYEHDRPDGSDGSELPYDYGYTRLIFGENIRQSNPTTLEWLSKNGAETLITAWKNSPKHNALLLNTGISISGTTNYDLEGAVGVEIRANGNGSYSMGAAYILGGWPANK